MSDLERGNLTWRQPWNSQNMSATVNLPLRWNNIPYTGINTILLWATASEKNYPLSIQGERHHILSYLTAFKCHRLKVSTRLKITMPF
ncbi:ArdC-like ssDNA-binding domain-containing protein [Dyadobacter sp. CY323]|uniref:ArdC-like ssDNA-binding domain-containing protein n=1 Tax=Dyadobacter sp. CY323 TaxID=2907302 RepID=UPI001EEA45A5|nr:ArdC-like ssDNA-binding domain-containing protein [Dyadobacter sp. CY323]MCE6989005.1 ssDNA-binding domain-containing protein [Dyadobacter sp. CY323]